MCSLHFSTRIVYGQTCVKKVKPVHPSHWDWRKWHAYLIKGWELHETLIPRLLRIKKTSWKQKHSIRKIDLLKVLYQTQIYINLTGTLSNSVSRAISNPKMSYWNLRIQTLTRCCVAEIKALRRLTLSYMAFIIERGPFNEPVGTNN